MKQCYVKYRLQTGLILVYNILQDEAKYVLYQPILTASGKTGYVIEMWRTKKEFDDGDEHLSSNYIVWGSLILQYCNLCLDKMRERNMTDFLLDVVK